MSTTRVRSKGQIVLPKAIGQELDWPAGTDLIVQRNRDSIVLRRLTDDPEIPERTVDEVAGILAYKGPPISIEDMEKGIERELRRRWRQKFK